jgi:Sep-tRNA:Cys-tRNA synthetase
MASFPHVRERVQNWETEVVHSQEVTDALLSIEGTKVLSDYPRRHTLTRIDTRGSFDTVAQQHKKRGYFLSSELKKRGITGVIPGSTRVWKFNTFGLTAKQIRHVGESFVEIARENGLNIV